MAQQAMQHGLPAPRDMMNWLAIVRGIITEPLATFRTLADARPWRVGLVFYLLTGLAGALLTLVYPATETTPRTPADELFNSPSFVLGGELVGGPLLLLASCALLYQIGLRQGGDGSFKRLLTTESFGHATVGLVALPLNILGSLVAHVADGPLAGVTFIPGIAVVFWSLFLTCYSVRASLRLDTRGAVRTIVFAIVIGFTIAMLGVCVFGSLFAALAQ